MAGGGDEENRFRDWLRLGATGCTFATTYAGKARTYRRITYYTRRGLLLPAEVAALDGLIDDSAKEHRFFISVFPHVRSPQQLGELLTTLDAGERWTCSHMPWRKHQRPDAALVRLRWRTPDGPQSSVMGFAPHWTMPITRVAPHVAIALWPGGFENDDRPGKAGPDVGLVDGLHGMSPDVYKDAWDRTIEAVPAALSDPPEDMVYLRQIAFCLPREVASALRFKDGSSPL